MCGQQFFLFYFIFLLFYAIGACMISVQCMISQTTLTRVQQAGTEDSSGRSVD